MKSFKQFVLIKESEAGERDGQGKKNSNWKKETEHVSLPKGFIPPSKMRPVIRAFEKSKDIVVHDDLSKPATMPKKTLYLTGGAVRDFVKGKSLNDYHLATNATPEQIATILSGAGFKYSGDRSGMEGEGEEFNIPKNVKYTDKEDSVNVKKSSGDDHMTFYVQERDNSVDHKVYAIGAKVGNEKFKIATFRKNDEIVDGEAGEVVFVDDPREDAAGRDLTFNAMYIPLEKTDKENKKLYDFNGGYEDLKNGVTKTIGNAGDRFEEDPLRAFRAIRLHCRFGNNSELDSEIKKGIDKFLNSKLRHKTSRIEEFKKEFEKALKHDEIDPACYIRLLRDLKLLDVLFPDVDFGNSLKVPQEIKSEKDKILQVAWLLQHNPTSKIRETLGEFRGENKTGWSPIDSQAVQFLINLKNFSPDEVSQYVKQSRGTGLSTSQIRKWVDMFDGKGINPDQVGKFANYIDKFSRRLSTWPEAQEKGMDVCDMCDGEGEINGFLCPDCKGCRKLNPSKRDKVLSNLEALKFGEFE